MEWKYSGKPDRCFISMILSPARKKISLSQSMSFRTWFMQVKLGNRDETNATIAQIMDSNEKVLFLRDSMSFFFMELLSELMKIGRAYKLQPARFLETMQAHGRSFTGW